MNPFAKNRQILSKLLVAGLVAALWAGCQSSARQNRRIYDRYAELVAERNRAQQTEAAEGKTKAEPANRQTARPAPAPEAEKPAAKKAPAVQPAKPAPVAAPKPVESPAPAPAPAPPAAPVQIVPPPAAVQTPASAPTAAVTPAAPAAEAPPADNEGTADVSGYTLKPGDTVQIFLRGIPNAELIEGMVDERGMVSLPLINEVVASGQTASTLARDIRRIYLEEGIYKNISVHVVVPTRYYFIQGEIRAPGRYQILSTTRLSQAIAAAGGYTEYASGRVTVKRGGKVIKTVRNAKRLDRYPDDDIVLEPDDIIEVRRSIW